MIVLKTKWFFLIASLCILILSCTDTALKNKNLDLKIEKEFISTLEKHLDAVTNRDLIALKSTLSPEGKMQLILEDTEIWNTVDSFMLYHENWFKDTTTIWNYETKILNTEIGNRIGIGITEVVYSEAERNGEPYFNRLIVSYALERIDNNWYIIKDHASSIIKSTDKK